MLDDEEHLAGEKEADLDDVEHLASEREAEFVKHHRIRCLMSVESVLAYTLCWFRNSSN